MGGSGTALGGSGTALGGSGVALGDKSTPNRTKSAKISENQEKSARNVELVQNDSNSRIRDFVENHENRFEIDDFVVFPKGITMIPFGKSHNWADPPISKDFNLKGL